MAREQHVVGDEEVAERVGGGLEDGGGHQQLPGGQLETTLHQLPGERLEGVQLGASGDHLAHCPHGAHVSQRPAQRLAHRPLLDHGEDLEEGGMGHRLPPVEESGADGGPVERRPGLFDVVAEAFEQGDGLLHGGDAVGMDRVALEVDGGEGDPQTPVGRPRRGGGTRARGGAGVKRSPPVAPATASRRMALSRTDRLMQNEVDR